MAWDLLYTVASLKLTPKNSNPNFNDREEEEEMEIKNYRERVRYLRLNEGIFGRLPPFFTKLMV